MYAELLAAEGRDAEALEYVNKVHRRAYGYDPDQASPVDYASLQDRTKTVDPEDHLADNLLLYERWAELFGEMRWWEDVRRISSGKKRTMPCRYLHPNSSPTLHPVWSRLRDIDGIV